MMNALAFLASGVGRMASVSALVIVLAVSCQVQTSRLHRVKGELEDARAALYVAGPDGKPTAETWRMVADRTKGALSSCQAAAIRQNSAVEALKADGDRRQAEQAQALLAAKKQAAAAKASADRILAIRPRGNDVCARMLDAERQITESIR